MGIAAPDESVEQNENGGRMDKVAREAVDIHGHFVASRVVAPFLNSLLFPFTYVIRLYKSVETGDCKSLRLFVNEPEWKGLVPQKEIMPRSRSATTNATVNILPTRVALSATTVKTSVGNGEHLAP